MRPIRTTIPFDQARAIIDRAIGPLTRTERVPIADCHGRVLADDLIAVSDVPPFARAMMDGYAVAAEDTFGASRAEPRTLRIVDAIYTGRVSSRRVQRGEAAEIATGAPLPDGADAVVMVEETERPDEETVAVLSPVYPKQHVGRRGADIQLGQRVLEAGDVLTPSRVGVVAAIGKAEVSVWARPTVAILSTGDEIAEPGTPLAPGHVYDINRYTLGAVVREHGGLAYPLQTAGDTLGDLERAIDQALAADLLVFSGGSSVGERDLMLDALGARGEVLFHGIAVKPGKPTAFGLIEGRPFFGMPGNPTSCLSNAYMLLVPVLRRLAHLPPYEHRTVRLPVSQRIVSTTGRHQFYTVRVVEGQAEPAFKASGDITSMSHADGFIEIPAQTDIVEKGQLVDVRLF